MISLSEMESRPQLADNSSFLNNEKVVIIQQQPVMECAIDLLTNIGSYGQVKLKARGDSIPTAVAVANVITEKLMKGNSQIVDITVDSENANGKYGMTLISTIQIIIAKKTN